MKTVHLSIFYAWQVKLFLHLYKLAPSLIPHHSQYYKSPSFEKRGPWVIHISFNDRSEANRKLSSENSKNSSKWGRKRKKWDGICLAPCMPHDNVNSIDELSETGGVRGAKHAVNRRQHLPPSSSFSSFFMTMISFILYYIYIHQDLKCNKILIFSFFILEYLSVAGKLIIHFPLVPKAKWHKWAGMEQHFKDTIYKGWGKLDWR